MPESPDFEQLALRLAESAWDSQLEGPALTRQIAEQLRLIWNARGAADERALKAELQRALDALIVQARIEIDLEPLIKTLDR